ncbi:hypothetical protein IV203_034898 [Nitzschia inconspicua]|uniref:MHD domain-containing protein n=1 Tax=Nitzschia inconspicua TaxID=303405 RepID=A0A9K3PU22_9STRA|nr:hypothetical protein IV203_034898 [Nitzschia inconspicua]
MMKLKANPRDTSPAKHRAQHYKKNAAHRSVVNNGPLHLHPSTSIDNASVADGIDSTATGLDGSILSGMTETIDSNEEKKIDDNKIFRRKPMDHVYQDDFSQEPEPTVKMTIEGVENYLYNRNYQVKTHIVTPSSRGEIQPNPMLTQPKNDPWSSDPWNDTFCSTSSKDQAVKSSGKTTQNTMADESFDTLQFHPRTHDPFNNHGVFEPFDLGFGVLQDTPLNDTTMTSATTSTEESPVTSSIPRRRPSLVTIRVVVQERLSILFDESAKDPVCRVVGRIFVQPPSTTKRYHIDTFCLTVRDKKSNIEHWDEFNTRCQNITATVPHLALDPGDQVFSVSTTENLQSPVVGYTCIPRLRPMPMLLKTKVNRKDNRCRVGIRIRANPQNVYTLTDVAILMIVPLDMDGSSLTMSRKDGVWDSMKRSLTWTIPKLLPGEIVDIQAQFKAREGVKQLTENSSNFPVLARSNGSTTFSRIDLNSDYTKDGNIPVDIDVQRSCTVLYRKI